MGKQPYTTITIWRDPKGRTYDDVTVLYDLGDHKAHEAFWGSDGPFLETMSNAPSHPLGVYSGEFGNGWLAQDPQAMEDDGWVRIGFADLTITQQKCVLTTLAWLTTPAASDRGDGLVIPAGEDSRAWVERVLTEGQQTPPDASSLDTLANWLTKARAKIVA